MQTCFTDLFCFKRWVSLETHELSGSLPVSLMGLCNRWETDWGRTEVITCTNVGNVWNLHQQEGIPNVSRSRTTQQDVSKIEAKNYYYF